MGTHALSSCIAQLDACAPSGWESQTQAPRENGRSVALAGALLFVGAAWVNIATTVAESLTPGYSISSETLSGLGLPYFSTVCSKIPDCLTPVQPASALFVSAVFLAGVLQFWSGLLFRRGTIHRRFGLALAGAGLGQILVAVSYLPFYLGAKSAAAGAALAVHGPGALAFFILAPLAAVSSYRFTRAPLRFFAAILGALSLVATLLFVVGIDLGLGTGGMERMITYPVAFWQIGFGGYVLRGLE